MQVLGYIDLYCERTGPAFWNEPLNALSNAVFPLVAAFAWRRLRQRGSADPLEFLVVVMAGLIGVGSFLFHTFAQSWSEYADIIPIWSFVGLFVVLCIYRMTRQDMTRTVRITLIAAAVAVSIAWFTSNDLTTDAPRAELVLNGSLQYAPAVLALLVFAAVALIRQHPIRHHLALATGFFLVALLFRTVDLMVCESTQGVGTHFLWHMLNGALVGVLLYGAITHLPPEGRALPR